jgi:hypothetical protein
VSFSKLEKRDGTYLVVAESVAGGPDVLEFIICSRLSILDT